MPLVPDGGQGDAGPQGIDVPEGYVDYQDLAPGIGWCATSPVYPYGYFTMNCGSDRDCPASAKCDDGMMCRAPCSSNDDCKAPMTCRPHGAPVLKFCECPDCLVTDMRP